MKNFLKKILINFRNSWIGKKQYQNFFESLYLLALNGMNFGGGTDPEESGEINAIKYLIKKLDLAKPQIIFDVGANKGKYTTILYDLFKDYSISIYSFEPSKITFKKLQAKLKHKKNIFLYNFGFGDENNTVTLFYDSKGSGLASVYQRKLDHINIKMKLSEKVEIKTIDSFCQQNKIRHIHFLKIDVEGHELNVFKGAQKMLKNGLIDFIQFEFGGCNIDSKTYFRDFYYLLNKNYKLYRILKDGLYPIDKYQETQEIFTTTNYFAERKNI